jgi:hypothetical protein
LIIFLELVYVQLIYSSLCMCATRSIVVPPIEFCNDFFPYLFCVSLVFIYFLLYIFIDTITSFISRITATIFIPHGIKGSFIVFIHMEIVLTLIKLNLKIKINLKNKDYMNLHKIMVPIMV